MPFDIWQTKCFLLFGNLNAPIFLHQRAFTLRNHQCLFLYLTSNTRSTQKKSHTMNYIFPTEELIQELVAQSQNDLGTRSQFLTSLGNPPCLHTGYHDACEVYHDGKYVYKFYYAHDSRLRRIALHNFLFGQETPYSIKGIIHNNNSTEKFFVVSQPFIIDSKPSGDYARSLLKRKFEKRFGINSLKIIHPNISSYGELEGDWYIFPHKIALDDLKDSNVFINQETNNVAVIDCLIEEMNYDSWCRKIGIASSTTLIENELEQNSDVNSTIQDFNDFMRSLPSLKTM